MTATYTIQDAEKIIERNCGNGKSVKFNSKKRKFEEVEYYREGDLFYNEDGDILQLTQIKCSEYALICINDGNRWSDESIESSGVITQKQIEKILDSFSFSDFTYIGNMRDKKDFLKCLLSNKPN